jgi:hypothetical protein
MPVQLPPVTNSKRGYGVSLIGIPSSAARFAFRAAVAARIFALDFSVPFPVEPPFLPMAPYHSRTALGIVVLTFWVARIIPSSSKVFLRWAAETAACSFRVGPSAISPNGNDRHCLSGPNVVLNANSIR